MTVGQGVAELEHRQTELQLREREILERGYLRRTNGLEAVRDALRRLGELGSPHGVLSRAPQELGESSQFDRIMLSEVTAGRLLPMTLWEREPVHEEVPRLSIALEYPLMEYEITRSRRTEIVSVAAVGSRSPAQLSEAMGWSAYVVAPVLVESQVVGMLHADADASARPLDELDREIVTLACTGIGEVFARAVLRQALRRHRTELQSAIALLSSQLRGTGAGAAAGPAAGHRGAAGTTGAPIDASLTPRETEILGLLARGQTNAQIASALAVREGTVKYHVKNILRKLGARSRADAVARYARSASAEPWGGDR